jgi:hypothetical protein
MVAARQATFAEQYTRLSLALSRAPNSLDPGSRGEEDVRRTLFAGVQLFGPAASFTPSRNRSGISGSATRWAWRASERRSLQGGEGGTVFPAAKLFFRQRFDLGGTVQSIATGANQLGSEASTDELS